MDDQASVNAPNGAQANGVLGSLSDFGNDIATLAELQVKLAALDAKAAADRAALPLGVALAGTAVALGAMPVLLLGAATLLANALHMAEGWAMVLVGGVALGGSLLGIAVAARRLRHCCESFRRSRDELSRNIAWVRTVLLYSGRPVRKRH